jgi:hypothetical protein
MHDLRVALPQSRFNLFHSSQHLQHQHHPVSSSVPTIPISATAYITVSCLLDILRLAQRDVHSAIKSDHIPRVTGESKASLNAHLTYDLKLTRRSQALKTRSTHAKLQLCSLLHHP